MSVHAADYLSSDILRSIVEHVFMPPKLPQKHPDEETERKTNVALCNSLIEAAQDFLKILPSSESPLWMHMIKTMELARRAENAPLNEDGLRRALSDMVIGDVFCMHIRAQNSALIVRRLATTELVQFEVFEVSPLISAVMEVEGKLLCSYPGPAVQIPASIFTDECFLRELSSFLVQMDVDHFDPSPTTNSADPNVYDGAHPRHISELLVGILRGYGQPAAVDRITKRIGDEVLLETADNSHAESRDKRRWGKLSQWQDKLSRRQNEQRPDKPWRRSPLLLILKVTLQTSLRASSLYKTFILFFHTHLLRICVRRDFPSELFHVMRAKISRRLSKLGPAVSHHVYRFVHDTAKATEALLSKRWKAFQDIGSIAPTSQLKELNFVADSNISLDKSYNHLTKALRPAPRGSTRNRFTPSHTFRFYEVQDFTQFAKGRLARAISEDQFTTIADFELSAERNLASWVAASTNNNNSIDVVASCILEYFSGAKDLYEDNPEDNSIMVLTIMDLWVALDRFAIQECPLLMEYSPEIPSNFLHPLLLHRSSAFKRALHIEEYLYQRHREALEVPSIFSDTVDDSCFAVKYFRASENLQRLFDEINMYAGQERAKKGEELASLKQKSESLLNLASRLDHVYSLDHFGHRQHSMRSCWKCNLHHQAALGIRVHEWPLPLSTVHAQRVVFELSPPHAFSAWRDITYTILRDIGAPSVRYSDRLSKHRLDSFPTLQRWAVQHQQYHRVTVASSTLPISHEFPVGSAEESLLFIDNQHSFKLFDRIHNSWMIGPFSQASPSKLCIPPVPMSGPYGHLHHFVTRTEHTPNDIITAQADCPKEINQHEFIAFTGLRSGPRLQWLNIARELASPFLSFGREEVHTLITQAAWQLGPLSNGDREWHADLNVFSFGNALLCEMECLLVKIKANWLEGVTVRTIALICSRLLASTTDPDIRRRAYALLLEARNVTYQWISEVRERLESIQDEISRTGLRLRLCMLAATCFATFDVCSDHVAGVLVSGKDIPIAVECAVIVHDNTPQSLSDDNSLYLTRLLSRHRRLLHNLEPIFGHSTPPIPASGQTRLSHACAYDEAFALLRPEYFLGDSSSWHALPRPNSRWISCVNGEGQEAYYDLLTGELVMSGKRSERLPQLIVEHPTYARVFGSKVLDVSPANVHGMDYMARSPESGYQILFSWNNGDLILQARNTEDSQLLQLIPQSVLLGDFPRHFVDEYIHWLDLSTGELEFRPAGSPWISRPSNWRLCIQRPGVQEIFKKPGIRPRAFLQKPSRDDSLIQVIGIRSPTFAVVSRLLSPLETADHIIATYTAKSLDVSLPRLRLLFFLNANWELECRSIPGYVIDENQSCGTMFGLRNKLILCPFLTSSDDPLLPRRVIIAQGDISFRKDGDFANIAINTDSERHIRWHEYSIDTDFGCLTSNTTLISKLYQCYLHALTSHCLPDPLLGQTGTEEALYILRSASCRSFQRLDVQEAVLLELISKLSPNRSYSSQSTVSVMWDDLPALSQHDAFCRTVRSILDHAHALEALYHPPNVFNAPNRNQTLLNRAACRNKIYYPSDLHISEASEQSPSLDDVEYMPRDIFSHDSAENVAYQTSWAIWNNRLSLDPRLPELWSLMNLWGSLGPAGNKISLRYSQYWLKFDAAQDWFAIYDLCRKSVSRNRQNLKIELSFSLSAAAYSSVTELNVTDFLVIFALEERFHNLSPPSDPSYTLFYGLTPDRTYLDEMIIQTATSEATRYVRGKSSAIAESVLSRWPEYKSVDIPKNMFNRSRCHRRIKEYLRSISRNIGLREHVLRLQEILQPYRLGSVSIPAAVPYLFSPQFITGHSKAPSYLLRDVMVSCTDSDVPIPSADAEPSQSRALLPVEATENAIPQTGLTSLEILIGEFQRSRRPLLHHYGDGLDESRRELLGKPALRFAGGAVPSHKNLLLYHEDCSRRKSKIFSEISAALAPSRNVEETSHAAGLWPRITPRSILRQLAQSHIGILSDQWKSLIVHYAVSFLKYQQSLRMLELLSRKNFGELLQETEAIHHGVLAESEPGWLLVQIEARLVARPVQVAIAREMISPTTKRNISLQLNMGEGKSSVIVPLVASTLANGSNLVRVVTIKPLSNQTFQLLVDRLSGLANRPIFYVPISRSLHMNDSQVGRIRGLYEQCLAERGVLVVQPEHILSQKLKHIDVFLRSQRSSEERWLADELRKLQDWLANVSRDVLDESDEILDARFQLIYSTGKQMPVHDHPNRWTMIQQVFSRLQAYAVELRTSSPNMIEIDTTLGGFPIIHIHDAAILQRISSLIIDDALEGRLPNLQVGVLPQSIRAAARRFLSQPEVPDVDHILIQSHFEGTTTYNGILLLRGLLMEGGVLGYVLKERRWKVDYGLDPTRTLLAVPYRAKGVPSLRAEFAHPDVAIISTCLSYYYGGLTKAQVLMCFDMLARLNNPEMEYDYWVESGQGLPVELRQLSGVNMEDETQVDGFLVPLFSKNKGVVDFYLSQVVFPRAAREFPFKLPTSAWDLVEHKKNITTGFSGTNDNRYLLPTSITQEDPDFVLGTSALVLQHLLQPENDHYECIEGDGGEQENVTSFLKRLVRQDPEIRVLLDVGAQMLELQNEELAQYWLSLQPDISAAIFFNALDHLTVVTQDGMIEPYTSSPFSRQLKKCVFYVDDAHIRGTDLKLPQQMRAAVTLGLKVTKDRLVQGCMRMRQLGKGHSVMFFAPGVVDRSIRSLIPGGSVSGTAIQAIDVIRWAVHRTCEDISHHLSYWAQQGLDHHKRFSAYEQYRSNGDMAVLQEAWLQSESRTLEEMYWITSSAQMWQEINSIPSLREHMERLGVTKLIDARLAEEQEREVNHEVESGSSTDTKRPEPPRVQPAQHTIHADVLEFIESGKVPNSSRHISPLLNPLKMARSLESSTEWSPAPLATTDFITTILDANGEGLTEYLRPVNWILSSGSGKESIVVVISPYEANELLPIIRKSKKVWLHIYAPRVTLSMRSFAHLTFYSIPEPPAERWSAPAHVRTELNLFAGQLYFDSREEYENVCALLALWMAHPKAEYSELDGFVPPNYRTGRSSPFLKSRIPILKTLIGLRRKGVGYHMTHLGRILNGKPLSEETQWGFRLSDSE